MTTPPIPIVIDGGKLDEDEFGRIIVVPRDNSIVRSDTGKPSVVQLKYSAMVRSGGYRAATPEGVMGQMAGCGSNQICVAFCVGWFVGDHDVPNMDTRTGARIREWEQCLKTCHSHRPSTKSDDNFYLSEPVKTLLCVLVGVFWLSALGLKGAVLGWHKLDERYCR